MTKVYCDRCEKCLGEIRGDGSDFTLSLSEENPYVIHLSVSAEHKTLPYALCLECVKEIVNNCATRMSYKFSD